MVMSAAFGPDGKRFATGSGNLGEVAPGKGKPAGEAQLWDTATGKRVGAPLPHNGSVPSVVFHPHNSNYLLTACMADRTARLWDTETRKAIKRFVNEKSQVIAVAISPDGKTIATGLYGKDERTLLWDAKTGEGLGELQHNSAVPGLAFSSDGQSLLTGSADYVARLWDLGHKERPRQTFAHKQWIRAVAFHPTNRRWVLTGGGDSFARLWDVETGKPVGPPMRSEGMVLAAAFSPDGKMMATGSTDGKARLWNIPVAMTGELNRIKLKLWAQVITATELNDYDVPQALDAQTWHRRWEQLQELGGPPTN
jgi:WD40 repeat protein